MTAAFTPIVYLPILSGQGTKAPDAAVQINAGFASVIAAIANDEAAIIDNTADIAANTAAITANAAAIAAVQTTTASLPFFIAGTFTSAQVLAQFPPASNGRKSINTTDLGLLTCDGVRWLAMGTPPIPPGAAILGYKTNIYTVIPSLAEIAFSPTLARLYNGCTILGPSNPNAGTYSTNANGQLQLSFASGTNNASGLCTEKNLNSQPFAGNLGALPFLLGSQGFYVEIAATGSSNNPDNLFAFYLFPQEHNTIQADHKPGDPIGYERWLEFDVYENGHVTDNVGFAGACHNWTGMGNAHGVTFTGIPSGNSGTLTVAWGGDSNTYPLAFPVSGSRTATFTNSSTAVTWTGGAVSGESITTIPMGYTSVAVANVPSVTSIDTTVEHIWGLGYEPVSNTVTWWLDGVAQSTLAVPGNPDPYVKTLHYFPIIALRSHGANVAFTETVRYFSAWTP